MRQGTTHRQTSKTTQHQGPGPTGRAAEPSRRNHATTGFAQCQRLSQNGIPCTCQRSNRVRQRDRELGPRAVQIDPCRWDTRAVDRSTSAIESEGDVVANVDATAKTHIVAR